MTEREYRVWDAAFAVAVVMQRPRNESGSLDDLADYAEDNADLAVKLWRKVTEP
jgi:hypothetical protein